MLTGFAPLCWGGKSRRQGSGMSVQTRFRSDKNVVDARLVSDLAKRQRF